MNTARLLLLLEITLHSSSGLLSMAAGALRSIILIHIELKMTSLQGSTVCSSNSYTPSPALHTWAFPTPSPQRGWGHITTGLQMPLQFLTGWEAQLFLCCLKQMSKSCFQAENAWKHASLLGKLSCCQINAKYTWVRSWCLSVVQLYPTHTTGISGNWYSHAEEHRIPQLDLVWSKLEQTSHSEGKSPSVDKPLFNNKC